MALSRKFLSAMGIDPEKIDEIITAHSETVEALKGEAEKYKAEAEKLPGIQKELDDLKKASYDGKTSYKEKYEKEHKDFEDFKTGQQEKETKAKKTAAYKNLLKEAGVSDKHIDAVLRVSDIDSVELDDDGKVKDAKDALKTIQDTWSDFIVSTGKEGVKTPTPPHNDGKGSTNDAEYARKFADNMFSNMYGAVPGNDGNNNNPKGGDQ